jgi:serine acetyltransferase
MKKMLEAIIRTRNDSFQFDPGLTDRMIGQFAWTYMWRLLRGGLMLLWFRNPKWLMLGARVRMANMSRITWGRFVKIDNDVFMNSLGTTGIQLGSNVGIGSYSRIIVSTSLNNIGTFIKIGNNVGIGEYAYLGGAGGIQIGDDTIIGQYFSCHAENHNYHAKDVLIRQQGVSRKGIVVGSNCWIGAKVTILDGVTIGNGSVIAAGSVVTRSCDDNSVIGGVPAKVIKQRA